MARAFGRVATVSSAASSEEIWSRAFSPVGSRRWFTGWHGPAAQFGEPDQQMTALTCPLLDRAARGRKLREKFLEAPTRSVEVARVGLFDRLQRVGAQENDVQLLAIRIRLLRFGIGPLGCVVVRVEGLNLRLAGIQVVADQEMLDLVRVHRPPS